MIINNFTPPQCIKHPFGVDDMLKEIGGWKYASKGRNCLFHILKSLNIQGPVLVPIYCCESVLQPINKLRLEWHCYDINPDDLNANVDSVAEGIEKYNAECVIAVSMYGNPCELDKLESLCQAKGVKLIDDAAQSFGAELSGKKVGYFGDAGFFSFSPGKPLAGHLGGAFRTSNESYNIRYKRHTLHHFLIYKDFEYNRCRNHNRKNIKGKLYGYMVRLFDRLQALTNDKYSKFEEGILYGIYKESMYIHNPFRTEYAKSLVENVHSEKFRILAPYNDSRRKGISHKYVVVCKEAVFAAMLNNYLHTNRVSSRFGYKMLTSTDSFPLAKQVEGCVVEIPLSANNDEFNYIKSLLLNFS